MGVYCAVGAPTGFFEKRSAAEFLDFSAVDIRDV
jgi:hypothetical protein